MMSIVKKNIRRYIIAPIPAFAFFAFYTGSSGVNNPVDFAFLLGIVIFLVSLAVALTIESEEERSKGYAFLATLPVTAGEVVRTKFLMMLGSIVVLGLAGLALLSSAGAEPQVFAVSIKTLLFCLALCVGLESVFLAVSFRFGPALSLVSLLTVTLIINAATFVAAGKGMPGFSIATSLASAAMRMSWFFHAAFIAIGIAVFLVFMRVAQSVKAARMI